MALAVALNANAIDKNTVNIVYNGTTATVTVASNISSYVTVTSGTSSHVKIVQSADFAGVDANSDNEDPRLQVIYARNNTFDGLYHGKSPFEKTVEQSALSDSTTWYACLDSTTFSRNDHYMDMKMSAAEVDLMHAEAVARGIVSGNAKELFVKGVIESIDYYYTMNAASTFGTPKEKPSDEAIQAYAESQWDDANPIKCIATQYWLHMGVGNVVQSLMNVRRTGYPELTFVDWTPQHPDCPEILGTLINKVRDIRTTKPPMPAKC